MFYKFCYAFIGFGFLSISLGIFANKKFKRFAIEHDFTSLGDFYIIPAIIGFIASIMFFYLAFRSEKNIKKYPEYLKCLNCETTWWFGHVKNSKDKCPNCGGKLVDLKKYETHKNRQRNLEKRKNKSKKKSVRNKRKK